MANDCSKITRLLQEYQNRPQEKVEEENNSEGVKLLYAIADKIGITDAVKTEAFNAAKEKLGKSVFKSGARKVAIPAGLKKLATLAAGPVGYVIDFLSDPAEGNPLGRETYYEAMKNILHAYYAGESKAYIQKQFDILLSAKSTINIEKEFGINSGCYKTIEDVTNAIKTKCIDGGDQIKPKLG